ncbi:hypothetical protein ES703_65917 [subsurface metagenome]
MIIEPILKFKISLKGIIIIEMYVICCSMFTDARLIAFTRQSVHWEPLATVLTFVGNHSSNSKVVLHLLNMVQGVLAGMEDNLGMVDFLEPTDSLYIA